MNLNFGSQSVDFIGESDTRNRADDEANLSIASSMGSVSGSIGFGGGRRMGLIGISGSCGISCCLDILALRKRSVMIFTGLGWISANGMFD